MAKKPEINSFSKGNIKIVRDMIQKKLDELQEMGITVQLGSIRYTDSSLTAKVNAEPVMKTLMNPKDLFAKECHLYGLKKEDYKETFTIPTRKGLKEVTFVKFDASKRKYPVIVKSTKINAQFKMSVFDFRKYASQMVSGITGTINHGVEI